MWLTTLDGMYSIVDKAIEGPDYVVVRARDEDSLKSMRDRIVDFAKTSDDSVYVKTGPEDGIMWNGKFWIGRRIQGGGTDYEWRMAIPRELLMGYFNLALIDLTYDNFKERASVDWTDLYEDDIAKRRLITLAEVWQTVERLWPKRSSYEAVLRKDRPVLTMIHGGEDGEHNSTGAY